MLSKFAESPIWMISFNLLVNQCVPLDIGCRSIP